MLKLHNGKIYIHFQIYTFLILISYNTFIFNSIIISLTFIFHKSYYCILNQIEYTYKSEFVILLFKDFSITIYPLLFINIIWKIFLSLKAI